MCRWKGGIAGARGENKSIHWNNKAIMDARRLERIVAKLKLLKRTDTQLQVFGSYRHEYKSKKISLSELSDFEEDLPVKYYQDLEKQFNVYLESSVIQNNQNGDNVNGNKVMGNLFSGNPFITINNPTISSSFLG